VQNQYPEIELLDIHAARAMAGGVSRNHFYQLIRSGAMPAPIKLGTQCARWVKAELLAAIDAAIAKRNAKPSVRGAVAFAQPQQQSVAQK
jgi:predicted DNA-binding transcriptional regulator AlpA